MYGFCVIEGVGADKPADGSNNLFGFPVDKQFIFIDDR